MAPCNAPENVKKALRSCVKNFPIDFSLPWGLKTDSEIILRRYLVALEECYEGLICIVPKILNVSCTVSQNAMDFLAIHPKNLPSCRSVQATPQPAFTCSKLTIETQEEIDVVLVSLLLTLIIFHTLFYCFYC